MRKKTAWWAWHFVLYLYNNTCTKIAKSVIRSTDASVPRLAWSRLSGSGDGRFRSFHSPRAWNRPYLVPTIESCELRKRNFKLLGQNCTRRVTSPIFFARSTQFYLTHTEESSIIRQFMCYAIKSRQRRNTRNNACAPWLLTNQRTHTHHVQQTLSLASSSWSSELSASASARFWPITCLFSSVSFVVSFTHRRSYKVTATK